MSKVYLFFSGFEPAQWVVIITAVISAVVSISLAIYNSYQQKKWNQKKIDADLTAKARIDWIEKVREHTADLLSIYYGILNETDKEKMFVKIQEAKKHSDILILYFGDTKKNISESKRKCKKDKNGEEIAPNVLFNLENNVGKNDKMVACISALFDRFNQYYRDTLNNKLEILKDQYERAKQIMYDYPDDEEFLGTDITEDGMEYPIIHPVFNPELENDTQNAKEQLKNYHDSIAEMQKLIDELRYFMRIYLKIEWDIAKQGK